MPNLNSQIAESARKNDEALPPGKYYLEVFAFDANPVTAKSQTGKYMPKIEFKVLQPSEFAGRRLFPAEYFVLGTDDDPSFDEDDTVGPGLGKLKKLCDAAGVACDGDVNDVLAEIQTVGAILARKVEPAKDRNGADNKYAGNVKAEIKSYFAVGDQAPEIFPDMTGGTASAASSKVAGLKAKATGGKPSGFGSKK